MVEPSYPFGLIAAKVAFADLNAPDFAAAGDMEAGLGSLMGLDFRHLQLLLPFPSSVVLQDGGKESGSSNFPPSRVAFLYWLFPREP